MTDIKSFDNKIQKVGDDLKNTIKHGADLFVSSNNFSIYGFESLKKEIKNIEKLKFIFTTQVISDDTNKERRLFEINTLKSITGTEFEINLKNKLKHSYLAKEAQRYLRKKAKFKAPINNVSISPLFIIKNKDELNVYLGIKEFSSAGFGYKKDNSLLNPITKFTEYSTCTVFLNQFETAWKDENSLMDITEKVLEYIGTIYKENSPEFIYYLILYHIFNEFLEDLNEDEIANDKTGFKNSVIWNKLYDFQKDAVLGLINKLEKFNGAILADSVGLGKTFTALSVIKYYQERNRSILVLTPKKLGINWNTYTTNYKDNPLIRDRFNYDVLYHTDLLRKNGFSNGIDLSRINWSNYDLLVIDESHNFRNNDARKDRKTRYVALLEDIIKKGVKTKVLMLSATPVNNKFNDLRNQIALIYEGKTNEIDEKLGVSKSVNTILKEAQAVFNKWSRLPNNRKTSKELLRQLSLNFDFFKLLDNITIARSRKHIKNYYDINKIGAFPKRLKPISKYPSITDIDNLIILNEVYKNLSKLTMAVYSPLLYIIPSKIDYYQELYDTKVNENVYLRQSNRENSLKILMRVNLLKRLESSVFSFNLTLKRFIEKIDKIINEIKLFKKGNIELKVEDEEFDEDFYVGGKIKIKLEDVKINEWMEDLKFDLDIALGIYNKFKKITPEHDEKLNELKLTIKEKINNPINQNNKKILIFTAFSDTADYLYENLKEFNTSLGLETAKITGSDNNKVTLGINKDFNNLLRHFSPKSKEAEVEREIDILIATDCISEGQNLQDCDFLINYDIHWNPVRIIQRFGRIDRIGSSNKQIQMLNFWPLRSLDDYINLKSRVEDRMRMVDLSATGEDNILTNESSDLEFRKEQLKKLQNQVIDLEDIDSTISITDLGLNDFKMDLIALLKEKGNLDDISTGLHTVVLPKENIEEGAVFILKNITGVKVKDNTNLLHPFYLVYVTKEKVLYNFKEAKNILDIIRLFSKGKTMPIKEAYEEFNDFTNDGKDMSFYSTLLNKAINSILEEREESMVDSLFNPNGTIINNKEIRGLDDFELIAFIIIKGKNVQSSR